MPKFVEGFADKLEVPAGARDMQVFEAGVAGVYNRASYLAEKRQALELWGAHVAALVEGRKAKIVPIRA